MMKKELLFSFILCLCCTFFMGCKDDKDDNLLPIDDKWTAENETKLEEIKKSGKYQSVESFQQKGVFMYYQVKESGNSNRKPTYNAKVLVAYEGQLVDGTVFDSALLEDKEITSYWDLKYGSLIAGWVDILQHMNVGDCWDVWIPASLAYGRTGSTQGSVTIPPYSVLNFKMKLLDIK